MMMMKPRDIGERTKAFALRIIQLYSALPKTTEAQIIGQQVLRSGTSVGAHVREGKRSRSDAELISKIEGGLQELEETVYWLELLKEADELIAVLVTSARTVKTRKKKQ